MVVRATRESLNTFARRLLKALERGAGSGMPVGYVLGARWMGDVRSVAGEDSNFGLQVLLLILVFDTFRIFSEESKALHRYLTNEHMYVSVVTIFFHREQARHLHAQPTRTSHLRQGQEDQIGTQFSVLVIAHC
jgi:hypothetical protein